MRAKIPEGLSIYLDVTRFFAASVVLLHHTWSLVFPRFPLPWPGHSAVVVFFVLSGYVITHASRPGIGLRTFIQHRMARILPVAIGSLLLSICLFPLANTEAIPNSGSMAFSWQNIGINAIFLGQSWVDIAPTFNAPFWSLNYEVWYYIIFGAWLFAPSKLLVIPFALIAGPKILLLLPVWLLGVALYKWMPTLKPASAGWLFASTVITGLAFFWFDVSIHIRESMKATWPVAMSYTQGSNQFVGDFLLGLIVAANFTAAASLRMTTLQKLHVPVRYLSSFTFSIYVFHMPLTVLLWNGLAIHNAIGFYTGLALLIYCLGELTERRTGFYRALLQRQPVGRAISHKA